MDAQKKTLGKLKLNQLSKSELEKREMRVLKGGCGCHDDCSSSDNTSSVKSERNY